MMHRILISGIFLISLPLLHAQDKYPSYQKLSENEQLEKDYRITLIDRNSPVSVLAIHGGGIEPGTSELTRAVGADYNQYYFEGIKTEGDNFDLHITSAKFDEPRGLALAHKSQLCLSIHGYAKPGKQSFCIGGRHEKFALVVQTELKKLGSNYEVEYPCKAYPGTHVKNIVNLCKETGVQLEMSHELRQSILKDQKVLEAVTAALKKAISIQNSPAN